MTVNELVELTVEPLTVTDIAPDVATVGTMTDRRVRDAAVTVAARPLMVTVLLLGIASNALPLSTTVEPTGPAAGAKPLRASVAELRTIPTMFPTASNVYSTTVPGAAHPNGTPHISSSAESALLETDFQLRGTT